MADDGSQQHKPDFRTAVKDAKALATVLVMEAESILGRRTARVLGVLVLFAVVVGILHWYIAPSGAEQKQALVVTLAQILGGAALLSGLYFTWRTLQVNREGQITERYTRAIDQLGKTDNNGNKLYEIRLGGIYALERIDKESSERAYHGTVMEVLTAYVRTNAPRSPEQSSTRTPVPEEVARVHKEAERSALQQPPTPPADIRAILNVLRRREEDRVPAKHRVHLDLQGTYLHQADLFKFNLSEANLFRADLSGAVLYEADLTRAVLYEANLSGARLQRADLSGAILQRADLSGAGLQKTTLSEANLFGAHLERANLSGANLSKAQGLTPFDLEWTIGNDKTTLPESARPDHWSKSLAEQMKLLRGNE
jgi:Pentapeptide repeats (8 copies)